jgi:hypothetical protein
MKKLVLLLVVHFSFSGISQHYTLSESVFSRVIEKLRVDDWDKMNVEGSPFLFEKPVQTKVISKDNKSYVFTKSNYQVAKDFFFYETDGAFYEIFPGEVKFIVVSDKKENDRIFVPGKDFSVQGNKTFNYFEVFTESPQFVYVLVGYKKILKPKNASQSYSSDKSIEKNVFVLRKSLFIKTNEGFVKVSSRFNKIAKALQLDKDMRKKMKKFISDNKLKLSKPEDLQKLMEYYYLAPKS